jgi:hypothetical protein
MLPATPIYPLLHRAILLFRAVRVPARLAQIVLLMIAVVAGFGVAGLGRRWPHRRSWPAAAVVIVALANLEALRAPFGFTPFTDTPPIYDVLAHERDAVIVELPFWAPRVYFLNGSYMLNSTRHWRPMLNGYGGFRPASYGATYDRIQGFPDVLALTALHERGVTHVVVHHAEFCAAAGPLRCEAIGRTASLQSVAEDGDIHIYRLK